MEIQLKVDQTKLSLVTPANLIGTSVNYYTAKFIFGPEWDGYAKTAVFYRDKNKTTIAMLLDEYDTCAIPWEKLQSPGTLYIGVFGVKDGIEIPTNFVYLRVLEGSAGNFNPPPVTLDIYAQILKKVDAFISETGGSSHTHNNMLILNALSDNNGILEYEGKPVSTTGITIDDTETAIDKTWSSNKINSELGKKVTAVAGKQLSTEDYTTDEKSKVATIDAINSAVNNITDKTMNVISTIVVPAGGLMSIEWNNLNNLTHARITALVEKGSNSQAYSFYYVNGVKSGSITTSIVSNAGKSLVAFEFEKHGSIWVQSYKRGNGTILHEVLTGLDMTNIVRITSIKLESYNITQNFPEGSTFVLEGY